MILVTCGKFDDFGGKPSGYASKLFSNFAPNDKIKIINGGNFDSLTNIDFSKYRVVIWFADIPNDKKKIVNTIKIINPKCMLISSKFNNGNYEPFDLVKRALDSKSNLLVEFNNSDDVIKATLWDALGNVYLNNSDNIDNVRKFIKNRIEDFGRVKRIASVQVGDSEDIPDQKDFFDLAKDYADKFHDLVHAVNTSRFMGNLSFRCQSGFPSFRGKNRLYISKRNIDKRSIDKDGFVAVDSNDFFPVKYYGTNKPSVDAPIQLALYNMMPKINYMLHAHVYIHGSDFTDRFVPCGDFREVWKVRDVLSSDDVFVDEIDFFSVNLYGHGSIIGSHDVDSLRDIDYYARPMPEYVK